MIEAYLNCLTASYAQIVKALAEKGMPWTKNTIITLLNKVYEGNAKNQMIDINFPIQYNVSRKIYSVLQKVEY